MNVPRVFLVPAVLMGAAFAATACGGAGAADPGGEPIATTSAAIYGGVVDNDASQNASVVAIEVGAVGDEEFYLCSGVLIAPNVVLTARHCLSTALTTTIQCDQNGNSLNGTDFGGDLPVSEVNVFATPTIYQGETPSATAKALFHPAGSTECNEDLALVVLGTPITTVQPARVRIAGSPTVGESTRVVGYGANDQSAPIGTRYRKDDLPVLALGSSVSASNTALGSSEFELGGESTCNGDSGGPALDETSGAVVGILSRGPADCTSTTGHVYTSLAAFMTLFQQAFAVAGGSWIDENGTSSGDGGGSSGGDAGSGSGSGGGSSSGGSSGSSSGGPHQGAPVDLQSGKGSGCSAGGVGVGGMMSPGLLGMGGVAVVLRRRRRRG
jgi:V8-like Glu-specific endopeptidase